MIGLETFGWLGGIMLAICGAPQAYKSYKEKHSDGISLGFLILWTLGEIFTFIYVVPKMDIPLLFNYTANLIFLSIIWKYRFNK